MTTHKLLTVLLTITLCCFAGVAHAVTIDWITVGNEMNGADTNGFGAVDSKYRIGKHEVTNAQYTDFLNTVAASDPNGLYNTNMDASPRGGIIRSGSSPNYSYSVKPGRDNNPVVFVSFFDGMRFTNWLHNGQTSGGTESGVYTIGTGTSESRAAGAKFFLPTSDEWYKAAYHDQTAGTAATYFNYPTGTNDSPFSAQPPGSSAPTQSNTANFFKNDGVANGYDDGYAVTGSTAFPTVNSLSDVGAYTLSESSYGTFDQGGNVWEWNEAVFGMNSRGLRGGSWADESDRLASSFERISLVTLEISTIGFRVASPFSAVPEPATALLALIGGALLLLFSGRRFRKATA